MISAAQIAVFSQGWAPFFVPFLPPTNHVASDHVVSLVKGADARVQYSQIRTYARPGESIPI